MKVGFVPALGTPIDENGAFLKESYQKQIKRMLEAGAVALLSMGSMGQQAFLLNETCVQVAEAAVEAAAGRVPVYVGIMDNSIQRAKARAASMEHLDIAAFVLTTPYYEIDNDKQLIKYFCSVAASTKHNILLYDLPGVTNYKITYSMVCQLKKEIPNLVGIKSADLNMMRKIRLNPELKDMMTFYSGMDNFDIAYPWGIGYILDGMPACTPVNFGNLVKALDAGDKEGAAKALNNILELRDAFLEWDLWPAFSAAMNMLGFEGLHAPDWTVPISPEVEELVRQKMIEIGELES